MLPLTDTLVLDLTQVIAGPTAGQILGDMGADVIKVEPLQGEHFRPHFGGAWVPSMNRNKRGLALDLRTPGGREVLMRLVRKADVFMEAFTPGVIDKLGFGWDVVSKENPRLVYASISGYGQTGPYSHRAGYDPCIQAEIGLMDATGPYQGEMCRVGTAPIDYCTGSFCAAGIAFALLARHKTGKGQRLDLSLFDVGMHMMSHWITNHGLTGEDPERMGTSNSLICPLRVFPTRTQPIFIAGTNDAFWRILCTALGRKDWLEDRRFATNADRVAHRSILEAMIEAHFLEHTADELLDKLIPAGMACSAAYKVSDVLRNAHTEARGSVLDIDYPGLGPVRSANNPLKLSDAPVETRRKAPAVGEHTVEIMREVGYSDSEIAALEDARAIGTA
ncbi:CaiB/BaiF CoA-transferase family protein [Enhydrobacter sp.]|jgi:crotonobetainyl-CoA:carnitine CoA-transferase CaiB-like acyl-CoA transferase|uniref:CaiB/BaiF CoA transferase family protein n=1 Tax=Enhydrobacter sp. TaxID=1894999 RepID=UPI0026395A49|nr:CaiB/BaiF CoA-transferase family protein [Enhydrobacter sp.]WIM09832.1 MAG: L-carnitine dehydratase/bile acid-inducible protein F [Enhydrobacter sp.]